MSSPNTSVTAALTSANNAEKVPCSAPGALPPTSAAMLVDFAKLLEGDLYEEELNAIPDLFLPDPTLLLGNNHGQAVQAAATAVVDAAFDPDDAFSFLEGFHKSMDAQPKGVNSSTSSASLKDEIDSFQQSHEGNESPTDSKSQMEMEINGFVPKKFSTATEAVMKTTLPDYIPNLPLQLGELFGKKVTIPKASAPVAPKRATKSVKAPVARPELTPIAPRGCSPHLLVPLAPAPTETVPNPVPTPALSTAAPTLWSNVVVVPGQAVLLPAPAPSSQAKPDLFSGKSVTVTKAGVETFSKPGTKQRRYRRKDPTMTEEEAEQEHRARNKEHAKNTRLRKKAYIEALKDELNSLVDQRDEDLRRESIEAETKRQHRHVRFQVLQTFLRLRGGDLDRQNPTIWSAVLEENATFSRPCPENVQVSIYTPSAIMADPGEIEMVNDLMNTKDFPGVSLGFHYECDPSSLLMDGCTCILEWKGIIVGAEAVGLPSELSLSGTLRATFNETTNKITAATVYYDTGPLRYQVGRSLRFP